MPTIDINLFSSSNISFGAVNKSTLGSQFSVTFPEPIRIPNNAKSVKVYCHSLNTFYTYPNISPAKQNNIIYLTDDTANYEKYPITIPKGLYSVDLLSDQIALALNASGFDSSLVVLSGNLATQKVIFTFNLSGYALFFKAGESPFDLLGLNANTAIPSTALSTSAGVQYSAPNVANFGEVLSLALQCSLVNTAYNNGKISQVLASIPIDVGAGQNIIFSPSNLIKVDAPNLVGSTISSITFTLCDQNLVPLDTNEDDYSLTVAIEYEL
jgi:hypothetical protein